MAASVREEPQIPAHLKTRIKPPSQAHRDVDPPSLLKVQQALTSFRKMGLEVPRARYVKSATEFHDEQGRMVKAGSAGGWYAGQMLGGAPHGEGEHRIYRSPEEPDHLLYDGEWQFGRKTGYAWVHYTNGQEYKGELVDGEHSGWGSLKYKSGDIYDGEWLEGRRHGQGTLYCRNGNWYDGSWCKDTREGWGIFYWPKSRRKFEGEWACNNPFTGCYSAMQPHEYELLMKRRLEFSPVAQDVLRKGPPEEPVKLLLIGLRHKFEPNYVPTCRIRKVKNKPDPTKHFRTQVERGRSLSTEQLEALKHAFQAVAPAYLYRAKLLAVHLRRVLVIARIDPDLPQGQKLLWHLQQCAKESARRNSCTIEALNYSDFLFSIYRFHDP